MMHNAPSQEINDVVHLTSLQEISAQYTTYLIDLVGVVYDGKTPFVDAINAINKLIKEGNTVVFVSNNPRPSSYVHHTLQRLSIREGYHLITSGDVLHHTLNTTLKDKKIYHLGRNRQHALLKGTNAYLTSDINDADAIIVSCFVEEGENIQEFDDELNAIAHSKKTVYCPNPDKRALEGSSLRYTSGYFAHQLEQKGCPVIYLGKPYPTIYGLIAHIYPDMIQSKTIMIGDTLETDIKGARMFGIDSLLVMSGITGLQINYNTNALNEMSYKPTYVMQALK